MIKFIKKSHLSFTIIALSISSLLFSIPYQAYSQQTAECPEFTRNQVLQLKTDFYESLNQKMSQATPVSSDLTEVYDLYRQLLSDLSNIFQDSSPNIVDSQNVLSVPQAESCQTFIESQKQNIQQTLNSVLNKAISQKQSFTLIEKYAQINQQFSDLKTQTDQVSNKVKTFSQKLPCYSQACVQD